VRCILLNLILLVLLLVNVGTARAQQGPCNQADQADQTRCQIAKAISTGNNSLMQRIFETGIYADVNDGDACGGGSYASDVL
jgi:hypothetical protein